MPDAQQSLFALPADSSCHANSWACCHWDAHAWAHCSSALESCAGAGCKLHRGGGGDAQLPYRNLQAFDERRQIGVHKVIERRKLEVKIKEFIRDSVRRINAQRG